MRLAVLLLGLCLAPLTAVACGSDTDCALGDRTYRILMPEGVERPGAVVFAHGYRGSASGTMRSQGLRDMAAELGVALVAVKSYAEDWRIPGVPADPTTDGAQERQYFSALVPALAERHGIDTDRLLLAGFSAGGMVTWQMACDLGDLFAGFAPIAGTFWVPVPSTCASAPVNLIHTHGTSDKIVPLAGRPIAETHQGDVEKAVSVLRVAGGYDNPVDVPAEGMVCTAESTPDNHVLELCLHDGGHSMRASYVARAWRRLEALGAL
ncbi:MAG: PHB depolymerase family esterase [Pseudomonadota bacterium]